MRSKPCFTSPADPRSSTRSCRSEGGRSPDHAADRADGRTSRGARVVAAWRCQPAALGWLPGAVLGAIEAQARLAHTSTSPCAVRSPGPSSRASRPPRAWPCGGPRWKRSSKHRTRLWDEGHYRDPDTGYPLPTWEQALDRSGWPLRPPSASRVRSRLLKVALGQVPLHGDPVPVDVLTATGCDSRCVRAALASASVRKPPTQRRLPGWCEQTRYQTGSTWIQAPGRTPLTCGRGSPGRNRTYVACPDSKSGGPCQQTNRGTPPRRGLPQE